MWVRWRATQCAAAATLEMWIGARSAFEMAPKNGASETLRGSSCTKASARSSAQLPKGRSTPVALVNHSIGAQLGENDFLDGHRKAKTMPEIPASSTPAMTRSVRSRHQRNDGGTCFHAELFEDVDQMGLDRRRTDFQTLADFAVGPPTAQQLDHIQFARGEAVPRDFLGRRRGTPD